MDPAKFQLYSNLYIIKISKYIHTGTGISRMYIYIHAQLINERQTNLVND